MNAQRVGLDNLLVGISFEINIFPFISLLVLYLNVESIFRSGEGGSAFLKCLMLILGAITSEEENTSTIRQTIFNRLWSVLPRGKNMWHGDKVPG